MVVPSRLILVTLVQTASAESNHPAGTPFLLVVADSTVRVPLASCVPHELMVPSNLTQSVRIGIIVTGGTDMGGVLVDIGELVGAVEAIDGSVLANAPAKLSPNTVIAVKRIAVIIIFF